MAPLDSTLPEAPKGRAVTPDSPRRAFAEALGLLLAELTWRELAGQAAAGGEREAWRREV